MDHRVDTGERNNMANGGYPLHLLTPVTGSEIELLISRQQVNVRQRIEPEGNSTRDHRPRFFEHRAFTQEQTGHLMAHLVKWMSTHNDPGEGGPPPGDGYPQDLELAVEDLEMLISVSTCHVDVRQRLAPKSDSSALLRPGYYEYGGLDEIQTAALLFHLFEWRGLVKSLSLERIRVDLVRQEFDLRLHCTATSMDAYATTNRGLDTGCRYGVCVNPQKDSKLELTRRGLQTLAA